MIARKYRWTKCPKDLEKRVKILVLNWVLQLEGLRLFTRLVSLHFCPCSSARGGRGRSAGVVAQNPYIRSGWHAAEGVTLPPASTPDTPSCRCCCCCCCSMGCSCRSRSCSCSCCCGRNCSCRSCSSRSCSVAAAVVGAAVVGTAVVKLQL